VHLAVKDDETEKSAIAFLREAAAAFPFRLRHVLTDHGSCFTPAFAQVCAELGAEYRHTKPYTPQTNGRVERFNGRVSREVLGITIYSHQNREQLLYGFNAAYNARPQHVLDGKTPDQVVAERLKAKRKLANAKPRGRADSNDISKARLIVEAAKEVSQPDTPPNPVLTDPLRLPDHDQAKAAVLHSLSSADAQRGYRHLAERWAEQSVP
jgi:hypothetical protein